VSTQQEITTREQAAQLSALAQAYRHLASRHRAVANALDRGQQRQITYYEHFSDWIFNAYEFSAQAERLLASEVELARKFGVTWQEIAAALGVSRQAAWDRFADQSRWQKNRSRPQLRAARRARLWRELRNLMDGSEEEIQALQQWFDSRPKGLGRPSR
jgi:hypothetical protein